MAYQPIPLNAGGASEIAGSLRGTNALHRDLSSLSFVSSGSPVTPVVADSVGGGSLSFNTAYTVSYVAGNNQSVGSQSTTAAATTSNNASNTHGILLTIPKHPNATYYIIFIGTGGASFFVAIITEAQRLAGGCRITAYNTVDASGANAAGTILIQNMATNLTTGSGAFYNSTPFFWGPDKLPPPGMGAGNSIAPTLADVTTGGSLAANTQHSVGCAVANQWGNTHAIPSFALTTANDSNATHGIRYTPPTLTGSPTFLDLFCIAGAVTATCLWVGRITVANLAAGGARITAPGVTDQLGAAPAGSVDIFVVGNGVTSQSNPFTTNTAFLPTPFASAGSLNGAGYVNADLYSKVAFTAGIGSTPTINWRLFRQSQTSSADWFGGSAIAFAPSTAGLQGFSVQAIGGSPKWCVLLDSITGFAFSAPQLWVEQY